MCALFGMQISSFYFRLVLQWRSCFNWEKYNVSPYETVNFVVATLKRKEREEINFSKIFYFTQNIQRFYFQHVYFTLFFFFSSLWNPVCILYLQDILIWVHHVSTAQKPHEANGYQIRQCSLKAWKSKFLSTLCKVPHAFLASSSTTLPHIPFTLYSTLVTLLVYTCTCPWLLPLEIFLIRVLFPLPSAPFAKPAPQP